MNHATVVLMGLLFVAAGYLSYRHYVNAKALLYDWAQANRFRILHARRGMFLPLSMMFTTSRYQVVYHVSLYDESTHRIRTAWVRLGTRYWGVMDGDAIDVKWEDAG
ncbi:MULTISPECIES: hypothetical protein [Rhodanobacter]|uniref:Uncharacterized protein n=1 Tax=Rhodanobacter glycinis TaxID=582702 RepID=A0A1I4D5B7_9GAMM|nr:MULTISPECIES: hypothetical protein [Rhodanobacter]EIM02106.1 hypothetical protein UU5_01357 [Rhodanobacter sp. 115]SFK87201.1 hypothetical protein SAMN05192579_10823 [Rhodanobacter glycinis]